MTAIEYLSQVQVLREHIADRNRELECWRSMARSISASNCEPHYNATKNTTASYTRAVEKADEIQREIEELFSEMVALCDKINILIDKMSDVNEQIVLRYRYIENYTWSAIGKSMGYSRSTILRIHGDAIKNFSLIF